MRIYAAGIFGLSLILTGCPDNPEKADPAMSMEDSSTSTMTTTEMEMPEKMDGMEKAEGMEKMEGMDHMEGMEKNGDNTGSN